MKKHRRYTQTIEVVNKTMTLISRQIVLDTVKMRGVIGQAYNYSHRNTNYKTSVQTIVKTIQNIKANLRSEVFKEYTITRKYKDQTFHARGSDLKTTLSELRNEIQAFRKSSKRISLDRTDIYLPSLNISVPTSKSRGVYLKPGTYLKANEVLKSKEAFRKKAPTSNSKHFGIELEFFCLADQGTLAAKLNEVGVSKFVHLKSDGSIKPKQGYHAHELTICVDDTSLHHVMVNVCAALASFDAQVNKSCGMHVHLDARFWSHEKRDLVFSNLVSSQSILYAMNPPSRKNGYTDSSGSKRHYAKPTRSKDYYDAIRSDRYVGINGQAFSKFGTIEVRLHSGTVDARKIINWVLLLDKISCLETAVARGPTSVAGFERIYKINGELLSYVKERVTKFKEAHDALDTSMEEVA